MLLCVATLAKAQAPWVVLAGEDNMPLPGGEVNGYNYAMLVETDKNLVDKYNAEWKQKLATDQTAQPLATPREMSFELDDATAAESLKKELLKLGFDLDISNPRIPVLKGVPEYALKDKALINIVEDALAEANGDFSGLTSALKDSLAISIARTSAFRENKEKVYKGVYKFILKYGLAENLDDIKDKLDHFDNDRADFKETISYPVPYHNLNALGALAPPLRMSIQIGIDFSSKGAVIGYRFLKERVFYNMGGISKATSKILNPVNPDKSPIAKEDRDSLDADLAITAMSSGIGRGMTKFLIVMNSKTDQMSEIMNQLDDFYNNINKRMALYDKLAEKYPQYYKWGTDEDIMKDCKQATENNDAAVGIKYYQIQEKMVLDEHKILNLSRKVVNKEFKRHFVYTFTSFAQDVDCKITAVMEDGKITWKLYGDQIMPVDDKLRKALTKKGLDYTTYFE